MEECDFKIGYHTSRQILLIHNSLTYTRQTDLEKPHIALILCDIKQNKTDQANTQFSQPKMMDIKSLK